jgi:hypothetical protein
MTLMVSTVEYEGYSKNPAFKQEVLTQTILAGGTATFYVRDEDAPTSSIVTTLAEGPKIIRVPRNGFYKVVTTGAATVYGDWC